MILWENNCKNNENIKKNLYKIKINFDCVVTDFLSNRENSSWLDTLKSLYQKKLSKFHAPKLGENIQCVI